MLNWEILCSISRRRSFAFSCGLEEMSRRRHDQTGAPQGKQFLVHNLGRGQGQGALHGLFDRQKNQCSDNECFDHVVSKTFMPV